VVGKQENFSAAFSLSKTKFLHIQGNPKKGYNINAIRGD
jgi:hypothetical protein